MLHKCGHRISHLLHKGECCDLVITIETIYYTAIVFTIYLALLTTTPIFIAINSKTNIKRFILPYSLLFCAYTAIMLFVGVAMALQDLQYIPAPFPLLAFGMALLSFIVPNIFIYLISIRKKKIKVFEWIYLNCYAAIPITMFLLWGCLR